jgi:hypothetical protein
MIKKILATSLFGLTLVMSGCGDTEGEDRLATQQMLDDGDFTGVISKLEGSAVSEDDYITLGAAYMGKSGLSLINIVSAMVDTNNTNDSAFSNFVTSVSTSSNSSAISDLKKAIFYYTKVVNRGCVDSNIVLNNSEKDICLYIGLASTSSAAVTIDLLADDIDSFGDTDVEDFKLTASVCGMNYAYDRNASGCSVVESSDVNFTQSNRVYTPLTITVDDDTNNTKFHYLMNDANRTVLTKDYCTATDFSTRTETYVTGTPRYYACPIVEIASTEELTTSGVLIDVLNNGMSSISAAASEETQSDIDEYKCDILGGNFDGTNCDIPLETDITEQNIVDYLNNQN